MSGLYACYTVVNMEGAERVGIVGYTSVDTPLFSKSGTVEIYFLTFERGSDLVQKLVPSIPIRCEVLGGHSWWTLWTLYIRLGGALRCHLCTNRQCNTFF